MGSFEYPCPKCGQAQKVRAPNGSEVTPRLCPACQQAETDQAKDSERAVEETRKQLEEAQRSEADKRKEKAHK